MGIELVVESNKVDFLRGILDPHADEPPIVTAMPEFVTVSHLLYEKPKGDGSDLQKAAGNEGYPSKRT